MPRKIESAKIYLTIVSIIGIVAFFTVQQFHFRDSFATTISFVLLGAIMLLSHFMITIPPYEKNISMDSAIYLAILFLYGPSLALNILLLNSVVYGIWKFKVAWWKHVFNFASYSLMIILSYDIFILFGGKVGEIQTTHLLPYILSLSSFFVINMILTIHYFLLATKESKMAVLHDLLRDKTFFISYFTTLLLSFVLGILIHEEGIFGLYLFVCIAMLLSLAYRQYFQLFQEVTTKAKMDYLTGLFNHGSFKELLEKEVNIAKKTDLPLSLALIDLDDFKKYNDLYGHIQGDQLLKIFGKLLTSYTYSQNFIPARYGGEEFAILMPKTNRSDALTFLEYFRKRINDTWIKGVEVLPYGCLSFSAGIVEYEKDTYSTSELLNKADQAMYLSKAKGKNMVQIYQEIFAEPSFFIEEELEKADQKLTLFLAKDVYTYRHSKRVFQYADNFSQKLNFGEHERQIFTLGALVHDIGKLEIPKDILLKKGKLDPHEWELVKNHVIFGRDFISTNKQWEDVLPLVELHHERYDGKGYPYGLKGENIPKLARILCIVDSFDAMTTERPYQPTKSFQEAFEELRVCSGTQFDPQYVEPFIQMIEEQWSLKSSGIAVDYVI